MSKPAKFTVFYGQGGKTPCHTVSEVGQFIAHLLREKGECECVTVHVQRNTPERKRK